jgi:hypothetical protein
MGETQTDGLAVRKRIKFWVRTSRKSGFRVAIPICALTLLPHIILIYVSSSGGGSLENAELNRRSHSLLWIRHEAMLAGLILKPLDIATEAWVNKERETVKITNSLGVGWWPMELLPLPWQSYVDTTRSSW